MPAILAEHEGTARLGERFRDVLTAPLAAPCAAEDMRMYAALAAELGLNPSVHVALTAEEACRAGRPVTGREILSGPALDEPDFGMDENLPDAADPAGDRPFMGGSRGTSSKGFRHMFFGGWKPWLHPISSFQLPLRPLGQAPMRAALMARKARTLLADPAQRAWGFRVLAWTLHYLQDLTQPFHASQMVSPWLIPWDVLLVWPPGEAYASLIRQGTRTLTNYHWAVEGYVEARAGEGEDGPWFDCLARPSAHGAEGRGSGLDSIPQMSEADPEAYARDVARASLGLAGRLGGAAYRFFGSELKAPGRSMVDQSIRLDYAALAIRPDLDDSRKELHAALCSALANTARVTEWTLTWMFGSPRPRH